MEAIKISSWSFHKKGTWLSQEQANDSTICIMIRGKASLHVEGRITRLNEGDCFGESAVLYNMPRRSRVLAENDSVIMTINANILNHSKESLQVLFLREFYKVKTMQLVETNLKLIQAGQ